MTVMEAPLVLTRSCRDISVTERMSFRTCRRRWYLETIENLEPRASFNWAFDFGTGLHTGLEAFYSTVADLVEGDPLDNALAAFEGWFEETKEKIFGAEHPEGLGNQLYRELLEYQELGIGMLENYNEFAIERDDFTIVAIEGVLTELGKELLRGEFAPPYGEDVRPVRHSSGRILVPIVHPETHERVPSVKEDGEPVYLSARLDLIVFRRKTGLRGFWVYDHKSSGSAPQDRGLDFDDQVTGYDYTFWRLTGVIPRGTVFNYLVKQLPKEPRVVQHGLSYAKDQLTLATWYKEAMIDHGIMVKGTVKSPKHAECYQALLSRGWNRFFRRFEVERNEYELLQFQDRLYEEYKDMVDAYQNPVNRAYPNLSQYICPGCPVDKICQAIEDGSDYNFIADNLYQQAEDRKA